MAAHVGIYCDVTGEWLTAGNRYHLIGTSRGPHDTHPSFDLCEEAFEALSTADRLAFEVIPFDGAPATPYAAIAGTDAVFPSGAAKWMSVVSMQHAAAAAQQLPSTGTNGCEAGPCCSACGRVGALADGGDHTAASVHVATATTSPLFRQSVAASPTPSGAAQHTAQTAWDPTPAPTVPEFQQQPPVGTTPSKLCDTTLFNTTRVWGTPNSAPASTTPKRVTFQQQPPVGAAPSKLRDTTPFNTARAWGALNPAPASTALKRVTFQRQPTAATVSSGPGGTTPFNAPVSAASGTWGKTNSFNSAARPQPQETTAAASPFHKAAMANPQQAPASATTFKPSAWGRQPAVAQPSRPAGWLSASLTATRSSAPATTTATTPQHQHQQHRSSKAYAAQRPGPVWGPPATVAAPAVRWGTGGGDAAAAQPIMKPQQAFTGFAAGNPHSQVHSWRAR